MLLVGALFVGALKSQSMLEQYRQSEFVNGVRALSSHMSGYHNGRGRWPGDCNRDGLLDHTFLGVETLNAVTQYNYDVPPSLTEATSGASYTLGDVCPNSTLQAFDDVNVPFNELKQANFLPIGQPNRLSAAHGLGGHAYLGTLTIDTETGDLLEERFNAIVLTRVPISAARRLAVAIDGFDGSAANLHRVRRSDDLATFAPLWTASGETEDKVITVVVLFDRVPPPTTP